MDSDARANPFEISSDAMISVIEAADRAQTKLKKDFPHWLTDNDTLRMDLRLGVFNLIFRVAHGPLLSAQLAGTCLGSDDWWGHAHSTRIGSSKSIALSEDFLLFLRVGYINSFFSAIDNSFRAFVFAITAPKRFPAQNFGKVCERLANVTNVREREEFLALFDLLAEIRNSFHSNGTYNPYSGDDKLIVYCDKEYSFECSKSIEFAGWRDLSYYSLEVIQRLDHVIRAERLSGVSSFITDLHSANLD